MVRPGQQLHPHRDPAPLLPAATVLLLRDTPDGIEVLMTRRSDNASFAPGAYVFPGGMLMRASEFRALAQARGLAWEDQEDFALDYAETLLEWRKRFDAAVAEQRLPAGFDARFVGLWRFYLMYCEGGFRGGGITVSQVTLVKS